MERDIPPVDLHNLTWIGSCSSHQQQEALSDVVTRRRHLAVLRTDQGGARVCTNAIWICCSAKGSLGHHWSRTLPACIVLLSPSVPTERIGDAADSRKALRLEMDCCMSRLLCMRSFTEHLRNYTIKGFAALSAEFEQNLGLPAYIYG